MKRSQPSFPEIKVLVRGTVWVPLWVCPSCNLCLSDSMLQSGTLFTFWTQLTSPSLSPSFFPSPSLHPSLSLFIPLALPLSLLLGFRLQPSLTRSSTCSGLPKPPLALLRGRCHCSWVDTGSSHLRLSHYGLAHTHTQRQWRERQWKDTTTSCAITPSRAFMKW